MTWEKAASIDKLDCGPVVFKKSPKQIALFRVGTNVYAVDNRCPHEGYPLAEGEVDDDCVLTCNWHNWKFRLEDGQCILGGDHVRTYPVKEADGHVWVNIEDPPPEVLQRNILSGLKTAFVERDFGRICRDRFASATVAAVRRRFECATAAVVRRRIARAAVIGATSHRDKSERRHHQ